MGQLFSCRLYDNRSTIAQHFCYPAHHLIGVIPDPDHGVGPLIFGVLHHELEGLGTRLFTQLGKEGNVSTDNRLKGSANCPED